MTQELIRLTLKEYEAQDPTQLCTPWTVAAVVTSNVHMMLVAVHLFGYWRGLRDSVWTTLSVSQACSSIVSMVFENV